jgi:hypothetical protein
MLAKERIEIALRIVEATSGHTMEDPRCPKDSHAQMLYEDYAKMLSSAYRMLDRAVADFEEIEK